MRKIAARVHAPLGGAREGRHRSAPRRVRVLLRRAVALVALVAPLAARPSSAPAAPASPAAERPSPQPLPSVPLAPEEVELRVAVEARAAEMLERLRAWVAIDSGTWNAQGLARLADELEAALGALGFEIERVEGAPIALPDGVRRAGPHLLARRPAAKPGAPRVVLSGHLDTVHGPDDGPAELRVAEDGWAYGPGAADMKGGLVVLVAALEALEELGRLDALEPVVVLVSDEEIGSLSSRELLERAARGAEVGLVFEAARADGGMVRSRRGVGQFHLAVHGRAAHAGAAHDEGRSAVLELAHKIVALEALDDGQPDRTVNVGTIRGGTRRNVVPAFAEAWVDVRYDSPEAGRALERAIEEVALRRWVPDTRTELWGLLHRPPKPPTPAVDALLELHASVARALGIALPPPSHSGGGTDGSVLQAAGVPTLDTLGPVGDGAHTPEERVRIASLAERAAVAAVLLDRIARGAHRVALYAAPPEG